MTDPLEIRKRIRKRIERDGLNADIAADVNIVVSTGGGRATARQDAPIHQGRSPRTSRPDAADQKEQP